MKGRHEFRIIQIRQHRIDIVDNRFHESIHFLLAYASKLVPRYFTIWADYLYVSIILVFRAWESSQMQFF